MHFELHSETDLRRLTGFPNGYPRGHPVAGYSQIPVIDGVKLDSAPSDLVAFDDRGRALNPAKTGIHFYREDRKFDSVLQNPLPWVEKFMHFSVVLTPDVTLTDDMPSWLRQARTCLSRAVGVVFQVRGIPVVPSLRWRALEDLTFVTAGIQTDSTIALSNYGARRDHREKFIFREGAEIVLELLKPRIVFLYGSLDEELAKLFDSHVDLHVYSSPTARRIPAQSSSHTQGLSLF